MRIRVERYSIEKLAEILAKTFDPPQTTPEFVSGKNHLGYFETYFKGPENKAATIVIEEPYTDRDFLEDYAAYYVRCFKQYPSLCARLHFFSIAFDQTDLDALIRGEPKGLTEAAFCDPKNKNYLGFVVIRPLPHTFIGRTCLRTYPEDGRRFYPVTRNYDVHLAGFTLTVRSLAFQEQDKAASACATSALWSAFNGTGILFHHAMHSPVEITRLATMRVPGVGRSLPNSGLTVMQMAGAVHAVGLEPETLDVSGGAGEIIQGVSYAYLRAGIPVLLVVSLFDTTDPGDARPFDQDEPHALHAVTVTGFSLGRTSCVPHPTRKTLLTCTRIDKLYVHDDQVGPFAKVGIAGEIRGILPATKTSGILATSSLTTSWKDSCGIVGNIRFVPEVAIVPLYHKIRIPYLTVLAKVMGEDNDEFEIIREKEPSLLPDRLEWDIFLSTGSAMHERIRKDAQISAEERWNLIQDHLPRCEGALKTGHLEARQNRPS